MTKKSPVSKALPKKIANASTGLKVLENGTAYIDGWPTNRRPVDMKSVPRQSVTEAASWVKKVRYFLKLPLAVLFFSAVGSSMCSMFLNVCSQQQNLNVMDLVVSRMSIINQLYYAIL